MAAIITARLDNADLLIERMATSPKLSGVVGQVVKKYTMRARMVAVKNLSNQVFTYNGEQFVIRRQTGKLARSVRVLGLTPLKGVIGAGDAETEYAQAVEEGHKAFDLKPFLPRNKAIPIRVKGPYGNRVGKGPIQYPVLGNSDQNPATTRARKYQKYSSTGKKNGVEYLIFRKVSATSDGWIIPAQPGRPFMAAAGQAVEEAFADELGTKFAAYLEGN